MSQQRYTSADNMAAIIALLPRISRGFPTRVMPGQDYKSGNFYPATMPGVTSIAAKATNNLAEMYFLPFFCRAAHTFTGISFQNGASVNTHKFHMGVYTSVGGYPSALVVDSGELTVGDANTNTMRTVTISQALLAMTPYWLAWQSDTSNQSVWAVAAANYELAAEIGFFGPGGSVTSASDSITTGFYATNTYGALPSTAPAITGSTDVTNNHIAPLVFLKG